MKSFLINLILFCLLTVVALAIPAIIYDYEIKRFFNSKSTEQGSILILGDSHFQNGIIDTLFEEKAINLSRSGETYFSAFQKLKYLYSSGKTFNKICVSLGPHNLDSKIDTLWVYNEENVIASVKVFYPIFNTKDVFEYLKLAGIQGYPILSCFVEAISQSFYSIERQLFLRMPVYLGGYVPNSKTLDPIQKSEEDNTITIRTLSKIQSQYLSELIRLAKANSDTVYLINTPLFNGTKLGTEERAFADKNVVICDYGDLFIGQSSHFADYVHLNPRGANIFTQKLKVDLGL